MAAVRRSPTGDFIEGIPDAIADGSYVGQPVAWDGSVYAPAGGFLDPLRLQTIQSQLGGEISIACIDGAGVALCGLGLVLGNTVLDANGTVTVNTIGGGIFQTGPGSDPVQLLFQSIVDPPTNVVVNLQMGGALEQPTIGFLGAAPVARQSITGATAQLQIDSLVAAGVALGLWTDDR